MGPRAKECREFRGSVAATWLFLALFHLSVIRLKGRTLRMDGMRFCMLGIAAGQYPVSPTAEKLAPKAPVAQLDRALDFESRGREFESLRARQ